MAYEQRDFSGALFKNERKEKETHPDYRGECLIDGVPFYMDAWVKKKEGGRTWLSFSFKAKDQKPKQQTRRAPPVRDEDDIPF